MNNIIFKDAHIDDASAILKLQQENLYDRDVPKKYKNGFVRIELARNQLIEIIKNGGAVVAKKGEDLLGYYIVAGLCDDISSVKYLIRAADTFSYGGKFLSDYKICYGTQTCIKKGFRGQGLAGVLFEKLKIKLSSNFELLFGSITESNNIGYQFSVTKQGGIEVGKLENRRYIVFDLMKEKN